MKSLHRFFILWTPNTEGLSQFIGGEVERFYKENIYEKCFTFQDSKKVSIAAYNNLNGQPRVQELLQGPLLSNIWNR